jgi:hypothetical protein
VDFYRPIAPEGSGPPLARSYLGYQHIVANEWQSNSRLVINTILNLQEHGPKSLESERRRKVRIGLKSCSLEVLLRYEEATVDGCLEVWTDLVRRTGWRSVPSLQDFHNTWRMLLDLPGSSVLVVRDRAGGRVWGFRILKIIGDTAYGDTIAGHKDGFRANVNDVMYYACLVAAGRISGVTKASTSIKSDLTSLEAFKTAIGFAPVPFPAVTRLRPMVGPALRLLKPASYRRMIGQFA